MMIIGQRADDFQLAPLIGLLGAVSMTVLLMYLPFLQILAVGTIALYFAVHDQHRSPTICIRSVGACDQFAIALCAVPSFVFATHRSHAS